MVFCFYLWMNLYLSFLFQLNSKLITASTLLKICAIITAIIQSLLIHLRSQPLILVNQVTMFSFLFLSPFSFHPLYPSMSFFEDFLYNDSLWSCSHFLLLGKEAWASLHTHTYFLLRPLPSFYLQHLFTSWILALLSLSRTHLSYSYTEMNKTGEDSCSHDLSHDLTVCSSE